MKIKEFLKHYDEANTALKQLNLKEIDRVKSLIFGYLFALIIVLAPIIILAHMFIYSFYFGYIVFAIGIFCMLFFSLGEILHHKLLIHYSNKDNLSLKALHIIDSLFYFLMCMLCSLVIVLLF